MSMKCFIEMEKIFFSFHFLKSNMFSLNLGKEILHFNVTKTF